MTHSWVQAPISYPPADTSCSPGPIYNLQAWWFQNLPSFWVSNKNPMIFRTNSPTEPSKMLAATVRRARAWPPAGPSKRRSRRPRKPKQRRRRRAKSWSETPSKRCERHMFHHFSNTIRVTFGSTIFLKVNHEKIAIFRCEEAAKERAKTPPLPPPTCGKPSKKPRFRAPGLKSVSICALSKKLGISTPLG